MQIRREQRDTLERSYRENRMRHEVDRILSVLAEEYEDFDKTLSRHSRAYIDAFWQKVDALTNYEEDELDLMQIYIDTHIDLFEHELFKPILEHPFLNDDAKARHLILAAKQFDYKE
jgi:hypothetical protein